MSYAALSRVAHVHGEQNNGSEPPSRIAISGAAGRIGYSLIFRIANGGLFGHDNPSRSACSTCPRPPRLEACAMELMDCAFPTPGRAARRHGPSTAFQDADWVILLGGKPLHVKPSTGSTCSTRTRRS